ncbi:unnamed protein product, partial [Prorocentrum cordatum]
VFSLCPLNLLGGGMFVSVVLTILSFLQPFFQGKLVDIAVDAFNKGETDDIWPKLMPGLTWVALSMLGSYLCEIVVGILFAVCGHTTVTRLRIKLFRNLTEQEIAFYDSHVSGELSSRLINDSAALSSLTQFTTQTMLGAIVKFVGSLVAMYMTHPELALLSTIITPVNTLLVRKTGKTVGHYGVVQNHAMAKANGVAIEVLGSIRTVQSNVGECQEASRFMDRLNYYLRIIKATVYIETVLRFTQFGLSKIRNVVVLAYAMHQVINGKLSIGEYTAFNQYINLYEDGFKNLADIWVNFKQTITSTGKFVQLLLRDPAIPVDGGRCLAECCGHLAVEDVDFAYEGRPDHLVLSKVNFVARPGDIIALVGESGAGKSTIGRLLLRYYDPRGGRVALDGVDSRELNLRWLRSQIGFVEQEPGVPHLGGAEAARGHRPRHHPRPQGAAAGRGDERPGQRERAHCPGGAARAPLLGGEARATPSPISSSGGSMGGRVGARSWSRTRPCQCSWLLEAASKGGCQLFCEPDGVGKPPRAPPGALHGSWGGGRHGAVSLAKGPTGGGCVQRRACYRCASAEHADVGVGCGYVRNGCISVRMWYVVGAVGGVPRRARHGRGMCRPGRGGGR